MLVFFDIQQFKTNLRDLRDLRLKLYGNYFLRSFSRRIYKNWEYG